MSKTNWNSKIFSIDLNLQIDIVVCVLVLLVVDCYFVIVEEKQPLQPLQPPPPQCVTDGAVSRGATGR